MKLQTKAIMIVEDDEDIRLAISGIFEMLGWTVYQAEEGYQALDVFETYKPQVVLTDINMPFKSNGDIGMDGIELINTLTNKYKDNAPLVFVNSGCLTNEMMTQKIEKVLGYYSKPTPATELISSMENKIASL